MTERLTIRQWRERRFLTQGELAGRVGVALNTVSLWELGKMTPGPTKLRRLAEVLDVQPEQLAVDFGARPRRGRPRKDAGAGCEEQERRAA